MLGSNEVLLPPEIENLSLGEGHEIESRLDSLALPLGYDALAAAVVATVVAT